MSAMHFDYSNLRQVFLQAIVIVCFGIATGLMFNYPFLMRTLDGSAPAGEALVPGPTENQVPQSVSLEEVEQALGQVVLIDARIPELFTEGHLPGAVSLPFSEVEKYFEEFRARVSQSENLIIYCSGYGCPDSFDLAMRLLAEGYLNVRVFEGGYPQWHDAGNRVEAGQP